MLVGYPISPTKRNRDTPIPETDKNRIHRFYAVYKDTGFYHVWGGKHMKNHSLEQISENPACEFSIKVFLQN
jgi:hypothetical protein